jgi:hypothetical protein
MTYAITLITWAALAVALFSAAATQLLWRRMKRTIRRLKALWAEEAPPVPPITVTLKTGDTIELAAVDVHKAWVWFVPMPFEPDQVDYIDMPDLPPWTSVVPVPPGLRP